MPAAIESLEDYDFNFASGAPKTRIQELASLSFIERAENIFLLGPSGVGKTHLASALVYRPVMARIKTRFITAADLMLQLAAAHRKEQLTSYFNRAILGLRNRRWSHPLANRPFRDYYGGEWCPLAHPSGFEPGGRRFRPMRRSSQVKLAPKRARTRNGRVGVPDTQVPSLGHTPTDCLQLGMSPTEQIEH